MSFISLSSHQPVARVSETATGSLGAVLGARFVMNGAPTEGRFSLVEHPIAPRGLAAPMHLHTKEDEFSFILEGRWGFQLADTVVYGEPGDLVYKPRNVWHSFWNATDAPARLLEIISPAGFEQFFVEVAALSGATDPPEPDYLGLFHRYGLQMDLASIPLLLDAHNLVMETIDHNPRRAESEPIGPTTHSGKSG
jgi:mannose-6-phosphate isomerase-like protein (cupin superfamily)